MTKDLSFTTSKGSATLHDISAFCKGDNSLMLFSFASF